MIIALHGGLSREMIFGIAGGFSIAILFFIFIHYRMFKSEYYNEEYVYFSSGRKIVLYFGFLMVNFVLAYGLFFVFTMLFGVISSYFLK